MKTSVALIRLAFVVFPAVGAAQDAPSLGQHPAVLVKRQQASQGYDYQSKFYPHPAWMYLETDRHEMGHHPAVLVARRHAEEQAKAAAEATSVRGSIAAMQAAVR